MKASDFTGNPEDDSVVRGYQARAELVVERKSGRVRQAGASTAEGNFVMAFKQRCEESLYCFLDGVMNYWFFDPKLHKPVCDWLQKSPPYRKLLLMPRNHGKSTIVGRGIPLHAMIQPFDRNIYFPGHPGAELRCVMAGETEARAISHMRVIKGALENNVLLRALWPHIVWDNPRHQAPKWSDTELIIPRPTNFPEATILAIGAGGAVTGSHPNMLIKDDITTEKAANEPPTMQKMIEWHQDSRALFATPETDLEFITATYWAAYDLPNFIEKNDPTVAVNTDWRQVIKDGKVIWPLKYGFDGAIDQLKKEHGVKFPLLYMNTVIGSGLTDFNTNDLRYYELEGETVIYDDDDPRDDEWVRALQGPPRVDEKMLRGWPLSEALSMQKIAYLRNVRGG